MSDCDQVEQFSPCKEPGIFKTPIRRCVLSLVPAVCILALNSPLGADENGDPALSPRQIESIVEEGLSAVRMEEWDKAVDRFREVVNSDSQHQLATFYLGYSLHGAERFAEAITFHERASRFSRFRQTALYNWSCALALQGKKREAIAKLTEAVDMGFIHQIDIVADSDMASLIGDSDFEKLRQRAMPVSQREAYQQFDFLLGDWDEFDSEGKQLGQCRVTRSEGTAMLHERWTGSDGETATGMCLYDATKQKWIRTWSNSAGIAVSYEGRMIGSTMTLDGRAFNADGKSTIQRLSLLPLRNGVVQKKIETSTDGGIEWTNVFSGLYRRRSRRASAN